MEGSSTRSSSSSSSSFPVGGLLLLLRLLFLLPALLLMPRDVASTLPPCSEPAPASAWRDRNKVACLSTRIYGWWFSEPRAEPPRPHQDTHPLRRRLRLPGPCLRRLLCGGLDPTSFLGPVRPSRVHTTPLPPSLLLFSPPSCTLLRSLPPTDSR